MGKNVAAHVSAVIKGILFIGFSIQIILGIVWMCCNFAHIQAFPETDAVVYAWLFRLLGERAPFMYALQLLVAFLAGYFFLQSIMPTGYLFAVWRGLALLTFPFAMQCHLALQPHSFVGSLLLVALLCGVRVLRGKQGKMLGWSLCVVSTVVAIGITGALDKDNLETWSRRGIEGNLVSRFGWYTIYYDKDSWEPWVSEVVDEVCREASYCPGNIEILLETVEEKVEPKRVKEYYRYIAEYAWGRRAPLIIRHMTGDLLGYALSPVVVQMQLGGDGYDSFTGRNYENMRNAHPMMTGVYVNYSCWWFVVALICGGLGSLLQIRPGWLKKVIKPVIFCVLFLGIWVLVLTLRGGGLMDYKWSIAMNELWLIWVMLSMGKLRAKEDAVASEKL